MSRLQQLSNNMCLGEGGGALGRLLERYGRGFKKSHFGLNLMLFTVKLTFVIYTTYVHTFLFCRSVLKNKGLKKRCHGVLISTKPGLQTLNFHFIHLHSFSLIFIYSLIIKFRVRSPGSKL